MSRNGRTRLQKRPPKPKAGPISPLEDKSPHSEQSQSRYEVPFQLPAIPLDEAHSFRKHLMQYAHSPESAKHASVNDTIVPNCNHGKSRRTSQTRMPEGGVPYVEQVLNLANRPQDEPAAVCFEAGRKSQVPVLARNSVAGPSFSSTQKSSLCPEGGKSLYRNSQGLPPSPSYFKVTGAKSAMRHSRGPEIPDSKPLIAEPKTAYNTSVTTGIEAPKSKLSEYRGTCTRDRYLMKPLPVEPQRMAPVSSAIAAHSTGWNKSTPQHLMLPVRTKHSTLGPQSVAPNNRSFPQQGNVNHWQPFSDVSRPVRPLTVGTKPIAKVFVICCQCNRWLDMPSSVYKKLILPSHDTKNIGVVQEAYASGNHNAGIMASRADIVECHWCEHRMSTTCCKSWTMLSYPYERHH